MRKKHYCHTFEERLFQSVRFPHFNDYLAFLYEGFSLCLKSGQLVTATNYFAVKHATNMPYARFTQEACAECDGCIADLPQTAATASPLFAFDVDQ